VRFVRAAAKRRMGIVTRPNEIIPFHTEAAMCVLLPSRIAGHKRQTIRGIP
jgi:hypothetical protein